MEPITTVTTQSNRPAPPESDSFRIRTITGFVTLEPADFTPHPGDEPFLPVQSKVRALIQALRRFKALLTAAGYTVQTIRIATNPFGEWLIPSHIIRNKDNDNALEQAFSVDDDDASSALFRLRLLDQLLTEGGLDFLSLGPARSIAQVQHAILPILSASPKFSCSAALNATDVAMAAHCAAVLLRIAKEHVPGGNFRFCVAAAAADYIPFFPVATAPSLASTPRTRTKPFQCAIGLENGVLAQRLLRKCGSISQIPYIFAQGMRQALLPLQEVCRTAAANEPELEFIGMDTSLNPSLDAKGSVAAALECLDEVVAGFGGPGTLAAAAALTQTLQSLPGLVHCGYSGIMLPVCEDVRLAALTEPADGARARLRVTDLLSISQVCGVGIDTVPLAVDETRPEELTAVLLDMAGLAHRWKKSLSCRVLPVMGKRVGERTDFDSPYMVNAHILSLNP